MSNNNFKEELRYNKVYTDPKQQEMHNEMMNLISEYQKNNSYENREFLCYLSAAIFLTYKEYYPQLSIYIPFRTKSDLSYIKNIQKEFLPFIKDDSFDSSSIIKDISGIKIILDNINFSRPSKGKTDELFNDPDIDILIKQSNKDFEFINSVNEFLQSSIQNSKTYFELKIELIKKIIEITPDVFTDERKPELSFKELYNQTVYEYNYFSEDDSFPTIITEAEMTALMDLLNEFRSRVHDPLQFAILRKTLPVVFEAPLIKNVLKTSYKYEKESLKANGFQSVYFTLYTPFGPIEVQSQSNKANYASTKGSAYHSGIPGKSINVKDFFELTDKNDKNDISYYLNILDSISADSMISPYEIPEFKNTAEKEAFFKTPIGTAFLESEKYRELIKHVKIKSEMIIPPSTTPIETDKYLLTTALSLSPYMNVCSSGHTSYTNAEIHHKKIAGEFAEVLRKKDSNTILRDLLIRKLKKIIDTNMPIYKHSNELLENTYMGNAMKSIIEHDDFSARLPKDISKKNIIQYGEKLRTIDLNKEDYSI